MIDGAKLPDEFGVASPFANLFRMRGNTRRCRQSVSGAFAPALGDLARRLVHGQADQPDIQPGVFDDG